MPDRAFNDFTSEISAKKLHMSASKTLHNWRKSCLP